MTKFGELISENKPVLIDFYADWDEVENSIGTLRDVAAAMGDKAKVIKIDIKKNETLADALRVKGNPTFMIYKDGEMKWRETGFKNADALITIIQKYL
jgi:thioredoxin 1|tara:strand:- start:53 stop:346 length:294 start_codon:yes stop_codon:yes gene_type:complete